MFTYKINNTFIKDLILIENFIFRDFRGSLNKYFSGSHLSKIGLDFIVKEIIEIRPKINSLRGLHILNENQQAKIVRVIQGSVFDVAVDLRPESKTYGKSFSVVLDHHKNQMLYIPKGFAHGFLCLEEDTIFNYMCSEDFNSEYDSGVIWNDNTLAIDWPVNDIENLLISEKDLKLPSFKEFSINKKKGF